MSYGGFVDITDVVRSSGAGTYTVGNVQSCTGFGGCFGSWSITVAFAHPSLPPRNLEVWHGWQLTTPTVAGGTQAFTVSGIAPPPRGPVHARIGVVQADGDRGLGPDSLDISSPSSPAWTPFATVDRPLSPGETDWFNSTVNAFGARRPAADATPNLLANLNQDIALVDDGTTIGNSDTSFSFRVQTDGTESLYSQVVHAAVDLYAPEIAITKAVDPVGPVARGDEVTWRLDVSNAGIDPVRHAVVTDPLPAGLAYVPGSVRYETGGPAAILGPKTDEADGDQVDWDGGSRTLTFRVGTGADGTAGGTMGIAPATDGSHALSITYRTEVLTDPGSTVANAAQAHGEGRTLQDPFGPLVTDDEAVARIATRPEADLGITKDDGGAVVRKVGDRYTYAFTVTNAGPSPTTGVTITDELDPHIAFHASPDGCRLAGGIVSCPIGDLAVGATATRHLEVEVIELPGAGQQIPNTATVTGDDPDPHCMPTTPSARCNHDDEETPQPEVDLGIAKDDGGAVVRSVGDTFTYRIQATNAGPDDATGVVVTDPLDDRLAFVRSDACEASGQQVTCPVGDLPAGGAKALSFVVRVVALPEPGQQIPNVATVDGAEPDPDCTPATPRARCNHDDELTPRPAPPVPTTTPAPRGPAPAPTPPVADGTLPRTGTDVLPAAIAGLSLATAGALALGVRRRRTARA